MHLRDLPACLAPCCVLLIVLPAFAQQSGFDTAGVRVIRPADPAFSRAVAALNATSEPGVKEMLPYSLVIENHSTRSIVMYAIWASGPKLPEQMYPRHGTHLWSALNSMHSALSSQIRPGSFALVSQVFTIVHGPGGVFRDTDPEAVGPYISQFGNGPATVELDAVVFEDSEFVGPDRGSSYPYVEERFRARHDVCALVMQDVQLGVFPNQTLVKLEDAAKQSGTRTTYDQFLKLYAKEIIGVAKNVSAAEALKIAQTGIKYPLLHRRGVR